MSNLSPAFLEKLSSVTGKRPRTVIDHIQKHGFITSQELKDVYGYNHPPRAVRDVREEGIPLETFRVIGTDGRKIAAYRFKPGGMIETGKSGGRRSPPKALKQALLKDQGNHCAICNGEFDSVFLQVDHRVPYEVAGEALSGSPQALMLLCGSCNRAKSWSCEHCDNWAKKKQVRVCKTCYWANPSKYTHIAMLDTRRLDIAWTGMEVRTFDALHRKSKKLARKPSDVVKEIIRGSSLLK